MHSIRVRVLRPYSSTVCYSIQCVTSTVVPRPHSLEEAVAESVTDVCVCSMTLEEGRRPVDCPSVLLVPLSALSAQNSRLTL